MFKKVWSLVLITLLMQMAYVHPASALTKAEKEVQFAEKVKAGIAKLGIGKDAQVEVKLKDKTKLKGYVSEANDDGFVVMNTETGTANPVAYPQVKQVRGNNLSQGVVLLIGIGALFALVIVLAVALK